MLPFGKLFEKGLQLATGQCNVKVGYLSHSPEKRQGTQYLRVDNM